MGLRAALFDIAFHTVMRTADRAVDAAYGVRTSLERRYVNGEASNTRYRDPETNMPSYYLRILALRRALAPGPDDVVLDLGCGSGRALLVFARAGVALCRGIDFDAEACRLAAANARALRGSEVPIEILQADAAAHDFSDETIVYLFNPFGRATLRAVLDNLRRSLLDEPRRVRIGYYHPVHADLLDGQAWLRRAATVRGFKTDIAIYETRALSRANLSRSGSEPPGR
jgi:SAM-dependent methyltransferase